MVTAPKPVKLKPCPFCGKKPSIKKHVAEQEVTGQWWFVSCTKVRSDECPAYCWTGANSYNEALRRWNRRAKA